MSRTFEAKPAVREQVPVLMGIMGPSGGGKTFSALRVATGIQQVTGGDIYGVDTEARRMLHYADQFKFKHVQFDAPFGSLDYLEAIQHCVKQGAKVIVIDSMSHEHEGPGGMLDFHDRELDRMAGNDYGKRERMKMLAWQKPKADRRRLINGILQLNANFVFCFRAKNTVKPVRVDGKTEIVPQGFMPIAGDEFVFEMTVNCLLMPGARGVPTWVSENAGERMMIKPARQFDHIFKEKKPLDESVGHALATWAKGDTASPGARKAAGSAQAGAQSLPRESAPATSPADDERTAAEWDIELGNVAKKGTDALRALWKTMPAGMRDVCQVALDTRHKSTAADADKAKEGA